MARHRKIFLALFAGAGVLLVLLAALFLLIPRLINTAAVKERTLALLERETGVRLTYAHAEVMLFPRPRVALRGVGLDVPGLAQGTVAALEADPELLPLLHGEVRAGNVRLESPDFRVNLPVREKTEKPVSPEEIEKSLSSLLAALRQRMPGTAITIRNGLLELSDGDGPIFALRELEARIALPPDQLTVRVRCASRYWEGLTIETSVRPEGLRAETRIETAGFRVRELLERLSPGAAPWLGETVLSLRTRIVSEGVRSAKAEVAGAVPALTVRQGSQSRVVRARTLKGALELNDKEIRATLSDLALDEPRLRLSGELVVDRASPWYEVKLTGQGMEIPPVRDTLLALAGDVPTVRSILDVVRGGTIPRFSLQSGGRSPGKLGGLDALRFQATLSGGSIRIPGPDLSLEEVGAEVTMEKGTLAGKEIAARLGNARARGGSLRIGFAEGDRPFHAEFQAEGDLGEMHPVISRLVKEGAFREELGRIRELRGNASGQVALGERLSSVGVRFAASKVRLAAKYDRIPFPVSIDGGQVSYDGASVAVKGLAGTVGESSFSGVTGKVDLAEAAELSITSGQAHLDPEAAKWVYERIGIPEPFRVKAPFTATGSEISWGKGGAVRAKVDLTHPAGPALSFSVLAVPGRTTIDPLAIRGADSDAKMALQLDPEALRVKFAGTLARVTLEKILPIPPLPGQRIRGELEAVLDRGKPSRSSARGTLDAAGMRIPWEPLAPLAIRDVSLSADGRTVRVLSSALAWDNVPFSLTGTAEFGGEQVIADLDVSAGEFDAGKIWRSVQAASARGGAGSTDRKTAPPEEGSPTHPAPKSFPLQGVVRLRADSISLDRFSWRPVRARAQVEGSVFRFTIAEANLCGISMTGSAMLGAGDPSFELVTTASGQEIDETVRCLSEERVAVTGIFGISSRLEGEGVGESAVRSLRGPVEVELKDGRIRKMTLLSSVLELLNVTDLLRGKFPDFRKKGFDYKTIVVRGEAKGGKFLLGEAVLDAPSMQIFATGDVDLLTREADLKVLVAPFQTVDAVVRNIPVLGYILGGKLVSVPISVKGDIRDPKVTTMEASAVGSGLLGIAERTLKSPVHLISPYLPGKGKDAPGGATPPANP